MRANSDDDKPRRMIGFRADAVRLWIRKVVPIDTPCFVDLLLISMEYENWFAAPEHFDHFALPRLATHELRLGRLRPLS
jgi:hypothetical protein